jgi:hypothetical protein
MPFTHVAPFAPPLQLLPHDPQLFGSVLRLTQVPPQLVCPDGQTQVPFTQDVPPVQTWPGHPPQWLLSVFGLMQVPLQLVCPVGQAQAPSWQVIPPLQAFPQLPQLPLVVRLTHAQ